MLTQTPQKYQDVLHVADRLLGQDPDWVTFFREILGVDGAVRQAFPSLDELTAFEQTDEYAKIQKMVVKLREKRPTPEADAEPTRVITVRLPASMHEYLKSEAYDLRTSMNKLCISKLLQVIGEDQIPNDRTSAPKPSSHRVSPPALGNGAASGSASSAIGGGSFGTQPAPQGQTPPPYKPTQPRF